MSRTITITFGVDIRDLSGGVGPFKVRRVYSSHTQECQHRHSVHGAALRCARQMAKGISAHGDDLGVEVFTLEET